jgi:hypothetical protein
MKTTQNVSKDNLDNLRNKILKCSKSFYDQIYRQIVSGLMEFMHPLEIYGVELRLKTASF